jgi:hypothetical protein
MTYWPPPGNQLPPEGHYSFRLNKEPALKTYRDKNDKEGKRLVIYAIALGEKGEFAVTDSFMPWETRYADLCAALGVEHGRDITMAGAIFEADIKHEPRKDKVGEMSARIVGIKVPKPPEPEPMPEEGGDDIPFS